MKSSAYAKAAIEALKKWNKMTLAEAQETITTHSREEIEEMCHAEGSVKSGFEALIRSLKFRGIEISDEEKDTAYAEVLDGAEGDSILKKFSEKLHGINTDEVALDALTEIHDNWVQTNPSKVNREGKAYMHMPLELIGWEAVSDDYIFLKPVMESMGIEMNTARLQMAYKERTIDYLETKDLWHIHSLGGALLKNPEKFYSALEEYPPEIIEKMKSRTFIDNELFPQILDHGNFEERQAERRERKAITCINRWSNINPELMYPERREEWEKLVDSQIKNFDFDEGTAMNESIEAMIQIHNGVPFEQIHLKQIQSYFIVRQFSKKGPEFYEKKTTMSSEKERDIVEEYKRENRLFALKEKARILRALENENSRFEQLDKDLNIQQDAMKNPKAEIDDD